MSDLNFEDDKIALKKKIPKEVKDKIIKSIFFNVIEFILMIVITFTINIIFSKLETTIFERCINVIQIVLALVTIILFEISYRKDNIKLGVYAIEWALFSISVLFVPFMYMLNDNIDWMSRNIIFIFDILFCKINSYSIIR